MRPVDGELSGWHPVMLGGVVGREALERAGLAPEDLDEVIVGCADPVGACGADVARALVLAAGWPDRVGGQVIDRGETSGLAAVAAGVAAIRSGQAETVLVLGLGVCSVVPPGAAALQRNYGAPWGGVAERLAERGGLLPGPRLVERAARGVGVCRAELDAAAEESRRLRRASGDSGAIVAVAARPGSSAGPFVRRGDPVASDVVREWGETAALPPAFDDGGLLTAATFAPPADAAAAVVLQAGTTASAGHSEASERDGAAGGAGQPGCAHTETVQANAPEAETLRSQGAGADQVAADSSRLRTAGASKAGAPCSHNVSRSSRLPVAGASRAVVSGVGRAAGDPFDPTGNVASSVGRALAEAGLELDAVDEIAVSEHDAATVLLVARALEVDAARINRAGGAVATGNSGAAEELRLITDGLAATGCRGTIANLDNRAAIMREGSRQHVGHLLVISAGPTGSAALLLSSTSR